MADKALLSVRGLHAGYGEVEILRGIDLMVGAGDIVAVLGSNGAGKSTLNMTISGLVAARQGSIEFDGRSIQNAESGRDRRRAAWCMCRKAAASFPICRSPKISISAAIAARRRSAIRTASGFFRCFPRLRERAAQRAGTLSGGEQQMLAIGRGLMAEPKLLILDEPSLGLSPLLVEEMFALIQRTQQRTASRCCWSSRTSSRASRSFAAPMFSRTAALCCRAAPPIFVPTPISSALISDYDHEPIQHPALAPFEAADRRRARRLRCAHRACSQRRPASHSLYVSGAAIAYTRLGRPDIGLVSITEVAETVALIRDRVDADLIVDADTGYGNALNVERTVRLFERAGASAIQLEDQDFPKRCGHLDGKALIPAAEMAGKIKAAVDARHSARHADHRPHRCGRGRRLRPRDRARGALPRGRRRHAVRRGAEDARGARPHRHSARPRRAADGQHGRGRQDAACCRRPNSKRSASRW